MTHKQFNEIIIMISELWSNFQATETILEVWEENLSNCDYDAIVYCIKSYAKDNNYPPRLADLLGKYNSGMAKIDNQIKSGCSWLYQYHAKCNAQNDTEVWEKAYVEFVTSFPIIKQMAVANGIIRMFLAYSDEHKDECIDFVKWLDGIKND